MLSVMSLQNLTFMADAVYLDDCSAAQTCGYSHAISLMSIIQNLDVVPDIAYLAYSQPVPQLTMDVVVASLLFPHIVDVVVVTCIQKGPVEHRHLSGCCGTLMSGR